MGFTGRSFVVTAALLAVSAQSFTVDNGMIVDDHGRRRVFHGVNAVEKVGSFIPSTGEFNTVNSLNDEDAELLQSWGMNVIRLGVMWPAVTPSPGVVNTTYLGEIKTMIETMAKRGIYTLVDMHQDVWSPYLCGEGMPDWVYLRALELENFDRSGTRAFPAPLSLDLPFDEATGYPDTLACQNHSFFQYYLTFESETAWKAVYEQEEIWGYMADHWVAVADALKGTTGLLGYEMINEPWPARGYDGSFQFLSDAHTLQPLYEHLHTAIRAVDTEALFFFEPLVIESYLSLINRYTDFPVGGPGGAEWANKSVLAYHSYCSNDASGAPKPMALCRAIVAKAWQSVDHNLQNLNVGGFLTEYGAVGDDDNSITLINLQAQGADKLYQSWAYWTYKSFDDITTQNPATETFFYPNGTLQTKKLEAIVRPYAPAVAGAPTNMEFDHRVARFALSFTVLGDDEVSTDAVTEVYVPKGGMHYTKGYRVFVSPSSALSYETTATSDEWDMISFTKAPDVAAGENVTISIWPKLL